LRLYPDDEKAPTLYGTGSSSSATASTVTTSPGGLMYAGDTSTISLSRCKCRSSAPRRQLYLKTLLKGTKLIAAMYVYGRR